MTASKELDAAIEAILFAAGEPVPRDRLAELLGRSREEVDRSVERVAAWHADPERGLMVEEVAGGLRLVSRPSLDEYLRRFFSAEGRQRLSGAALETLAIVAYRQPVSAPEIQELRGKQSSGVLKTLLERRLVRIAGRKPVVGRPFLYATTREFLIQFGLAGLEDLPPLEDLDDLLPEDLAELVRPDRSDREEELELLAVHLEELELEDES